MSSSTTRQPVPLGTGTIELEIGGMTCASCAARVEKKLNKLEGVTATVNYATEKARVSYPDTVSTDDLVATDNCYFVATGITDGELLRGVRYRAGGATTESLVMRSKSGTVRTIEAEHRLSKVAEYASEQYQ